MTGPISSLRAQLVLKPKPRSHLKLKVHCSPIEWGRSQEVANAQNELPT